MTQCKQCLIFSFCCLNLAFKHRDVSFYLSEHNHSFKEDFTKSIMNLRNCFIICIFDKTVIVHMKMTEMCIIDTGCMGTRHNFVVLTKLF